MSGENRGLSVEVRAARLNARAEDAARRVLANRRREVGALLRNAWTEAARAASIAVRRAKAASRTADGPAGAAGRGGSVARGGSMPAGGVPPPEVRPPGGGDPHTPYEGQSVIVGGTPFVVRGGVLVRTGGDADVQDDLGGGAKTVPGADETLLSRLRAAGVEVGAASGHVRRTPYNSRLRRPLRRV